MSLELKKHSLEQLVVNSLKVIDTAYELTGSTNTLVPLLSGGHDSICATFISSLHKKFDGNVYHIDTGIGSKATKNFVIDLCKSKNWNLKIYKSKSTYEKYVSTQGFPGPGRHGFIYNRLKDRCINKIVSEFKGYVMLITGCRYAESKRRMGHVEPIKIGEKSKKTGIIYNKRRVWVAPIHDWLPNNQHDLMEEYDLPKNPVKMSPLGMSGECFCGAFARPFEINLIREFVPDVAEEIDRLTLIAKENGKHCVWGTAPKKSKKMEIAETGPLCTSCDLKAKYSGYCIKEK